MYDVYETCPHCDCENHYKWNEEKGYVAICLNCGKEIMLCAECPLLIEDKCDWAETHHCSMYNNDKERLQPLND